MTFPACGIIVEEEEANEVYSSQQAIQGGQTRHVTILMPVADSSIVGHTMTFEDGASTDDSPEYPPGPSAVAIAGGRASIDIAGVLEPSNSAFAGDTTEDTDEEVAPNFHGTQLPPLALAVDNHAAVEALPADLPGDDAAAEETGVVDLGWGIVLPELSLEDIREILSFHKL